MRKQIIYFLSGILIIAIVVYGLIIQFFFPEIKSLNAISYSFISATAFMILFQIIQLIVENKQAIDNMKSNSFNVFLLGCSSSGKTTLIKNISVLENEDAEPTNEFTLHKLHLKPNLKSEEVSIMLADYRGQNFVQITDFFEKNPQMRKKGDALIVLVDLAPGRKLDGSKYSLDELISFFSEETNKKLIERTIENMQMVNMASLQFVFDLLFDKNEGSKKVVRFIINKIDVLEKLQENGLLTNIKNPSDYARYLYRENEKNISNLCLTYSIDFEVHVISAINNYGEVKNIFHSMINKYKNTQI